jgi:hypothetical protein
MAKSHAARRAGHERGLATIANNFDLKLRQPSKTTAKYRISLEQDRPAPPTWRFLSSNVGGLFDQLAG